MKKQSIDKVSLIELYSDKRLSMQQIAHYYGCSLNKVDYWMRKYAIPRRSRADAAYQRANPHGDPFSMKRKLSPAEWELWGLGIGLYWGEGTKASPASVRIGNSDPGVILLFMRFLINLCGVDKKDIRIGLQLFTDCDEAEARSYWAGKLGISEAQFYKVVRTRSGRVGTYRRKNLYGVATLYYNNKKLRDILVSCIDEMPR